MLKKTIKYTDYDGNEREEDFYFNLNKAELIQMNFSAEGGLENTLRKIVAEKDIKAVGELVRSIVLKAYGEKSFDGKRFMKSAEAAKAFEETNAFSELYVELLSDADNLASFVTASLPPEFQGDVTENTPAS